MYKINLDIEVLNGWRDIRNGELVTVGSIVPLKLLVEKEIANKHTRNLSEVQTLTALSNKVANGGEVDFTAEEFALIYGVINRLSQSEKEFFTKNAAVLEYEATL
ncbi:MAG: hypothetical protein LBS50_08570 [Prevotellaceae bacterium]|jgi:hypothetical protein|nr:hypothetical protein [Prevotellaceae bacterium]